MKKLLTVISGVVLLSAAIACSSQPDGVVPEGKMVDLMTDVYRAEALADINYSQFHTDTARTLLKQAVFDRYGITQEEFDSTMMWYGIHLDKYLEINEKVTERLERMAEAAQSSPYYMSAIQGDSVDTWTEGSHYVITRRSPSDFLQFRLENDENWEKGDSYTWQFKNSNRLSEIIWGMCIDYDDGSTDFRTAAVTDDGWNRLTVVLDTLRNPQSVYGYMQVKPIEGEMIFIDSLSLVRRRFNPEMYRQRYGQQRFYYGSRSR